MRGGATLECISIIMLALVKYLGGLGVNIGCAFHDAELVSPSQNMLAAPLVCLPFIGRNIKK